MHRHPLHQIRERSNDPFNALRLTAGTTEIITLVVGARGNFNFHYLCAACYLPLYSLPLMTARSS